MSDEAVLTLERTAYLDDGTRGRLILPHGWSCYTIERPWLGNAVGVSCIPEGVYPFRLRRSGVVERSTAGEYLEGWEVAEVPQRTYIMIHPGNTMDDLEGCIAPGNTEFTYRALPAVGNSRATFRALMARLAERDGWTVDVRAAEGVESPQWP